MTSKKETSKEKMSNSSALAADDSFFGTVPHVQSGAVPEWIRGLELDCT